MVCEFYLKFREFCHISFLFEWLLLSCNKHLFNKDIKWKSIKIVVAIQVL